MIRLLLFLSILVQSLDVCCQNFYFKPDSSVGLDKSLGKELLKQCAKALWPHHVSGYFTVDNSEASILEMNFKKIFLDPHLEKLKINDTAFLKRYAYQYMGITIHNEKYIYINAFVIMTRELWKTLCDEWKTKPVTACDGWISYFQVIFKLSDAPFSGFHFNGIG